MPNQRLGGVGHTVSLAETAPFCALLCVAALVSLRERAVCVASSALADGTGRRHPPPPQKTVSHSIGRRRPMLSHALVPSDFGVGLERKGGTHGRRWGTATTTQAWCGLQSRLYGTHPTSTCQPPRLCSSPAPSLHPPCPRPSPTPSPPPASRRRAPPHTRAAPAPRPPPPCPAAPPPPRRCAPRPRARAQRCCGGKGGRAGG